MMREAGSGRRRIWRAFKKSPHVRRGLYTVIIC